MANTENKAKLRADAESNRTKIIQSASELFASVGLDTTLDAVASHAGVGVGTVYRRFPSKEALVDSVFEPILARLAQEATTALAARDPWSGLVRYFGSVCNEIASNRALIQVILFADSAGASESIYASDLKPEIDRLVERAHLANQLKSNIRSDDFIPFLNMISTVTKGEKVPTSRTWKFYFGILLDGMRAHA